MRRDRVFIFIQSDGNLYFRVNSGSPGCRETDRIEANSQRWNLVTNYPGVLKTDNLGFTPNDAMYHAEATILMRAAKESGGSLADQMLEVAVDQRMCNSCSNVLPVLGLQLGNPTVRFTETDTGCVSVMSNGTWLVWRRR